VAAAIQLHRYGIQPLLLERLTLGGLLNNANLVENYPGFPDGIEGPQLVKLMQSHVEAVAVTIRYEEVVALRHAGNMFEVKTAANCYQTPAVIIASGTKPLLANDLVIDEAAADTVFYEVFPMRQRHGQRIAIVGAGDAAFDYALNLSRQNTICLLNRGNRIKALPLLVERVQASLSITYEPNVCLNTITCENNSYVSLHGLQNSQAYQIEADAVVFAIGREPQLDFLTPDLHADIDNLYFAGDVKNGRFRQTAIAVADGIKAAMRIFHTSAKWPNPLSFPRKRESSIK